MLSYLTTFIVLVAITGSICLIYRTYCTEENQIMKPNEEKITEQSKVKEEKKNPLRDENEIYLIMINNLDQHYRNRNRKKDIEIEDIITDYKYVRENRQCENHYVREEKEDEDFYEFMPPLINTETGLPVEDNISDDQFYSASSEKDE